MPYLRDLQDEKYMLLQNSQDIQACLEHVGMPKEYHDDITGIVAAIAEGEYDEIYFTESYRPYDFYALYEPASYYFELPADYNGVPIHLAWYK